MRFAPFTPVRVVLSKWGGRPHWEFTGLYLGADRHGEWLGFPAGTRFARPGARTAAPVDQVTLVPTAGWLATFHAAGGPVQVYVDVTTPAHWHDAELHATDLDLDVVRLPDDTVRVEDEEEFAEHARAWAYPPEVVATAEATCAWLQAAVAARRTPFGGAAATWLALLAERE